MENKKVLIITYYWPPSGGVAVQRWVKFVKYLAKCGWQPTVYTVSNGEYSSIDTSQISQIPEGTIIIKRPIWEPFSIYKFFRKGGASNINRGNIKKAGKRSLFEAFLIWIRGNLFVPDSRFMWIGPSTRFLKKYLRKNPVHMIITTGPPHSLHLIGLNLSKLENLPWLADFRDPWTSMDYHSDLMLSRWAEKKHQKLERKVLNNATGIVVVGELMKREFQEKTRKNIFLLPNGFDPADFEKYREVSPITEFSIAHCGSFLERRDPHSLWKVLSRLKSDGHPLIKEVVINLVGRVDEVVAQSIRDYGIGDLVKTVKNVPHAKVIWYLKSAQILLLPIDKFEGAKWVLTGKLYEYMASKRPILCIGPVDGDAAWVIRQTNSGQVFDFEDELGLHNYLISAYNDYKSGNLDVNQVNLKDFSSPEQTKRLVEIMNSVIND